MRRRASAKTGALLIALGLLGCACQRLPQKEIPKTDLRERGRVFKAVEQGLSLVEAGNPNTVLNLVDHFDHRVRRAAIFKLGELGLESPVITEALVGSLEDEHPRVRSAAVRTISSLKISAALPAMIPLLVDQSASVRLYAGKGIRQFDQAGFGELVTRLGDDRYLSRYSFTQLGKHEVTLRSAIEATLANAGSPAVPTLIAGLGHPNRTVRARVPAVLGRMDAYAKDAITPMLEALDGDDQPLRAAVALALGPLGGIDKRITPKLNSLKTDPNAEVAGNAAAALQHFEQKTSREKQLRLRRERKIEQQRRTRARQRQIYDGRPPSK